MHSRRPDLGSPSAKLVGVAHGSIFDVAVDLRLGSPTYGKHVTAILDATSQRRLFIPEGFAHGYATLEPDTTVSYSISDCWEPSLDRGVLRNDPTLDIDWPIEDPLVSLEITDVNHAYLELGDLHVESLGRGCAWVDAGTADSLMEASSYVQIIEKRQGMKIGCPEEVAFRMGFIDEQQISQLADGYGGTGYRAYLRRLVNHR